MQLIKNKLDPYVISWKKTQEYITSDITYAIYIHQIIPRNTVGNIFYSYIYTHE